VDLVNKLDLMLDLLEIRQLVFTKCKEVGPIFRSFAKRYRDTGTCPLKTFTVAGAIGIGDERAIGEIWNPPRP